MRHTFIFDWYDRKKTTVKDALYSKNQIPETICRKKDKQVIHKLKIMSQKHVNKWVSF
jgi:hypothetical protein